MDFERLTRDDLTNVRALNRTWLELENQQREVARLSHSRVERLAAAPFLLFSFRERDDVLWQSLLGPGMQADLLDRKSLERPELGNLQTAGLAFLWELARRNPFVARVVSGATLAWCNALAAATLADLLGRVTHEAIIEARFSADDVRLDRLLANGVSRDDEVRRATQLGVLHSLLTDTTDAGYGRLPAAACSTRLPHRKVADEV
ncbi:MAG: hypothetical protein QNJ14_07620 [Woeseiaceae bacterium]|nr:hypothetical protein [Woeseiaceae bacterium]